MKNWEVPELDRDMVKKISKDLDLPSFMAMLLVLRNITKRDEIEEFFNGKELIDPFSIKDMDKAVSRIKQAVTHMEKICVYGDYDCDGVTSTAIMYSYLHSVFAQVIYYIPDRNKEGYGLNKGAVKKLKDENVQLILTVDNGITAIDEIEYANSLGIDVVVTDHHKPLDMLPRAVAVVDPHRTDEKAKYRDYCGAGLALMMCMALEGDRESVIENYSDLAAMGTIADIVPLTGDNRIIAKLGLKNIEYSERIGLAALVENSGTEIVDSGAVGFRLAPRINSAGRLSTAYNALELLLTENDETAQKKAELLGELNARRQQMEKSIYNDILEKLQKEPHLMINRIMVVSSKGWNAGVVGIVASKITELYGKPSIIISEDGNMCRGSGRSVDGFSLVHAIFACSDLLERYGGHPMAAGISIKRENIAEFTRRINEYAENQKYMPLFTLKIDSFIKPEALSVNLPKQLKEFEPFGCDNPSPVFGLREMKIEKISSVGNGGHIRLTVSKNNTVLTIMKFSTTLDQFPYEEGDIVDFAVALNINKYMGKENLSVSAKDIHISGFDFKSAMYEIQDYELYKKGTVTDAIIGKCPERNDFAAVYRYICSNPKKIYTIETLCKKSSDRPLGAFSLLMILDILCSLNHIEYTRNADILRISLPDRKFKASLDSSSIYNKLKGDTKNA